METSREVTRQTNREASRETTIRFAQAQDAQQIWQFIYELAQFQKQARSVEVTAESIRLQMESSRPPFECLLAEHNGQAIGFALFYNNYSTWTGRPGIHLEDLYVVADYRGHGIGRQLVTRLAEIALARNYSRMEFSTLAWNENTIAFNIGLGAVRLSNWIPFRLDENGLRTLARKGPSRLAKTA